MTDVPELLHQLAPEPEPDDGLGAMLRAMHGSATPDPTPEPAAGRRGPIVPEQRDLPTPPDPDPLRAMVREWHNL